MPPLQFCTTSSRRYLPYARALGETILRHQPDATLWILLTGDHAHEAGVAPDPLHFVWNEELDLETEELHRLFLIHGENYNTAVRPFLINHVLDKTGGPVLFVDSDIHLYGSLDHLAELIEEHGVVLTPHTLTPYPLDDLAPDDTTILSAGTFNAGMIGVGEKGRGLSDFLVSRLRRECYVDPARHRVGEQRWLDLAPSYFPVHVLRDTGVNVAYWNLHERPLTMKDGVIHAGGSPLRTFHFSGYEFAKPDVISRHAGLNARVALAEQPIASELCAEYRDKVLACGYESTQHFTADFAELPGGILIDPTLRAVFRAAVIGAEKQGVGYPPDPYDLSVRPLFLKWAELTYESAKLPLPSWVTGVAPASAVARDLSGELLRRLAASSSAAISNLDQRIGELERQLARYAQAS